MVFEHALLYHNIDITYMSVIQGFVRIFEAHRNSSGDIMENIFLIQNMKKWLLSMETDLMV